MALRLSGTSPVSERPLAPSELAAQAAHVLSAGDVEGYASLFARAAAHQVPAERYHARLVLVERGLHATSSASPAGAAQIYVAVAEALMDILAEEPREPALLNYAGVALYELWALDASRQLFKAALRLDASLPQPRRNLAEVERRMRAGGGPTTRMRPVHTAVPGLARQAKRVAERARPATGHTLSLCMIVRDEEEMLARCLAAAAPAVDEIVIVDTGSVDRTIEIARSFGARVIEREWTGSFAEARNASFEAATGDWLMYLDADEVLVTEDTERLRALTGRVWCEAFYLLETSHTGEDGEGTGIVHPALRVFRNRPGYRFEGAVHEQISQHLPMQVPGRVAHTSIRVEHFGYLGSVRDAKEKSRRNIELLEAQRSEGAADPFLYFNLGTEYASLSLPAAAVAHFERAWQLVRAEGGEGYDYVPTLLARLVSELTAAGRAGDALNVADEGLALFAGFTDLVYGKALALAASGHHDEAVALLERCLDMGDAPARYGATVGAGTFLPLRALAALHQKAGDLASARALLEQCLERFPKFVDAVGTYANVLLASGVEAEAVVAEVLGRGAEPSPSLHFNLARALHRRGALDAAEEQYRAVLERRPSSSHVRVTLAEILLGQGRHGEVAALTDAVADDDPFGAAAARLSLWSAVAGGALEAVPAARARAEQAGVSSAELEVFGQWEALCRGEGPGRPLSIAGTPLLGVILETLLRSRDFDTFERLVALLHASELPEREQRELLATLYLRFGFLASAGREWMLVCEQAPDARALAGLAQVAAAHGLPEDAVTFAEQALLLDPANAAAQLVREQAAAQPPPVAVPS